MKDITTPVPPEEMKNLVHKCLEQAAHINYRQLVEYAQIKGTSIKDRRGRPQSHVRHRFLETLTHWLVSVQSGLRPVQRDGWRSC